MEYELREWRLSDAADLAAALNDRRILDNLRDGLPYPYTEKDAEEYITAMLTADKNEVFARAIAVNGRAAGSITAFRQENITAGQRSCAGVCFWSLKRRNTRRRALRHSAQVWTIRSAHAVLPSMAHTTGKSSSERCVCAHRSI